MAKVISSSTTATADATVLPPSNLRQNKKNQLEGIARTDAVHTLLQTAMDLVVTLQFPVPETAAQGDIAQIEKDEENKSKDDCDHDEDDVDHNINELLNQMMVLSQTTQLPSLKEAVSILQQPKEISQNETKLQQSSFISISVLRAMETIFNYCDKKNGSLVLSMEFEQVMQGQAIHLVYSNSLSNEDDDNNNDNDDSNDKTMKNDQHLTKEQRKFQLRMRQLRLQNEERKYMKITSNVNKFNTAMMNDDNITTKSMTYAASIGLNMIVAPITFGVFMYFFAGSLFDYFWPTTMSITHQHHHSASTVDVKKVIAGVISGVIMLFIEMILFVIRTHELDKAMMKKKKKQGHITSLSPFGHYKSTTAKSYVDH